MLTLGDPRVGFSKVWPAKPIYVLKPCVQLHSISGLPEQHCGSRLNVRRGSQEQRDHGRIGPSSSEDPEGLVAPVGVDSEITVQTISTARRWSYLQHSVECQRCAALRECTPHKPVRGSDRLGRFALYFSCEHWPIHRTGNRERDDRRNPRHQRDLAQLSPRCCALCAGGNHKYSSRLF